MSLIVRTGLRTDLPPTGSGYTQKTLAELQTYTAAAHLGQVIQVTDRAEAPNTFTWAYSVGTTWKSVYTQTVVSSDPSTLHPLKAVTQWNSVLKDIDSTPAVADILATRYVCLCASVGRSWSSIPSLLTGTRKTRATAWLPIRGLPSRSTAHRLNTTV